MRRARLAFVFLVACGQGAPPAGGDTDLPSALVGPFRPLRKPSEGDSAPHILGRTTMVHWQNPGALDLDGDPSTLGFALYVEREASTSISRVEYADGPRDKKSQQDSVEVLLPTLAWEAGRVSHPMPLRRDGEVWLYYSAGGCVGLAKGPDGVAFTKVEAPLVCDAASPLSGPAVLALPGGGYRLYATRGAEIVEAESADGLTFGPFVSILGPSAPAGDAAEVDQPFDAAGVGDPHPLQLPGADGRTVTYVYYTGTNRAGATSLGLAARFEATGPLTRSSAPVLTRFEPRSPTVLRHGPVTLLYTSARSSEGNADSQGSIVAALTPATLALP